MDFISGWADDSRCMQWNRSISTYAVNVTYFVVIMGIYGCIVISGIVQIWHGKGKSTVYAGYNGYFRSEWHFPVNQRWIRREYYSIGYYTIYRYCCMCDCAVGSPCNNISAAFDSFLWQKRPVIYCSIRQNKCIIKSDVQIVISQTLCVWKWRLIWMIFLNMR